jgi:hypothetical protein
MKNESRKGKHKMEAVIERSKWNQNSFNWTAHPILVIAQNRCLCVQQNDKIPIHRSFPYPTKGLFCRRYVLKRKSGMYFLRKGMFWIPSPFKCHLLFELITKCLFMCSSQSSLFPNRKWNYHTTLINIRPS